MGSSAECCPKSIDASAGGLVWVRRRNGSWWPGQIMGQELLDGSATSPQTGTPVKLLGRDDVTVDWYNLEKSKCVKAFRCGEYDKCIEKAKAVAANYSKKVSKYTRRENAILHALEIESACLGKVHANSFSSHPHEESENKAENGNGYEDYSSSSFEEANTISASKEQPLHDSQHQTSNDSEDVGTEGANRMRGLDNLGMGVVQSLKRKRSQVGHARGFLKKKRRRRRSVKVLESTSMVSVPVVCEGLPSPNASDLKAMVINSTSDARILCENNGTSTNVSKNTCGSSFANCKMTENASPSILELPENDALESLFDVPFVTEEKHSAGLSPIVTLASQKGTSKWHSKGKRNSRHTRRTNKSSDISLRPHKAEPLLYEVTLEVKSSYRSHHVPYISLVSKLNGRAITGHPLAAEALDDGFCAQLLTSNSEYYSSSYDKSLKSKKNSLLSKKMRKLSSLTRSQMKSQEKKLMTQKVIRPLVVACVPLKVVFSRINEALNSSVRPTHCSTGTSNG